MNKEFGETHLRGFMVKVLNDLVDFFNVGKSIGAVTHVFVQDSTKGYGIFIENMLKQVNLPEMCG